MQFYKADLHIHTVLSPCGDLYMSPSRIIDEACKKDINILGLTDHNATHHAELMIELGKKSGIYVMPGCEVNTKEEVHCLVFFENLELIKEFQIKLDVMMTEIQNSPDIFGYQVLVDKEENILSYENRFLWAATQWSINELQMLVHEMNGIFIPSHIDRKRNGLISQLGFIPENLECDAYELYYSTSFEDFFTRYPEYKQLRFIRNSDAHRIEDIGRAFTQFKMDGIDFEEIRKAIHGFDGREMLAI